ncbi:MAG: VOC family protein [Candidatus Hydrogenedentota bacterium]
MKTLRYLTTTCVALTMTLGSLAYADVDDLPFGMTTSHLNLVFAVSDADKTNEFYGKILGLKRISDLKFPEGRYMIRYLGGESEIKFIVNTVELPKFRGGTQNARGIRLMALFLPDTEKAGIIKRLKAKGHDTPTFTAGPTYEYGMVYDHDGNQVELVFFDDTTPEDKLKGMQIGMTVSDQAEMNAFLSDILSLEKIRQITTDSGTIIDYYAMGYSGLKFWEAKEELPAWVGPPFEKVGMNLVQFLVPDVDAVRATVLKRGGKIHTEPFALGKFATIMFVDGPDGILFEFAGPLLERLK